MKLFDNTVLDAALNTIKNNAVRAAFCSGVPANYAGIAALTVINQTIDSSDFTGPEDHTTGRKLTLAAQTGMTPASDAVIAHIALNDNSSVFHALLETGPTQNSGTAQAGGASTITLAAAASSSDDAYNGYAVKITSGTGAGQTRIISDYVGSTRVATVNSAWGTQPDNTSVYTVWGQAVTTSQVWDSAAAIASIADPT